MSLWSRSGNSPYREPASGETNTESTKEIDLEISRDVIKCKLTLISDEEISMQFKGDQTTYNITIDVSELSIYSRDKFYKGKLTDVANSYIKLKFGSAHRNYKHWLEKLLDTGLFIDVSESRIINKNRIAEIEILSYPENEFHHFIFRGIKNE